MQERNIRLVDDPWIRAFQRRNRWTRCRFLVEDWIAAPVIALGLGLAIAVALVILGALIYAQLPVGGGR